ncbi:transcriptional regulator [Brasilonema sp. UFV-L1]|nr:transcriptional regulator [Brasilonema sp. UFV-L1]
MNPEIYANLLAKYQPKVIKTDEENEQAIALAEELAHRLDKTAEESALLELLIALIEKYENETYPMGKSSSHSMLLHLMEARGIEEADLVEILSSSGITSEVIQGTEVISEAQAQTLANFFKVDPGLFF